jgi:hypothetical protein
MKNKPGRSIVVGAVMVTLVIAACNGTASTSTPSAPVGKSGSTIQIDSARMSPEQTVPPANTITIDSLKNEDIVPCENLVEGTYSEDITLPIWPVVYVGGRYFPMDDYAFHPASKTKGKWSQMVRFGDCNNLAAASGKTFQLLIVSAGPLCEQAAQSFLTGRHAAVRFPGMDGLPLDCMEYARIVVIRK